MIVSPLICKASRFSVVRRLRGDRHGLDACGAIRESGRDSKHSCNNKTLFHIRVTVFVLDKINRIDRIKRLLLTIDTVFVLVLKRCRTKVNQSMHGHCRPGYLVAYFINTHDS